MDKAVQIRMPQEWHDHLKSIAHRRGPGTKVTALIREAIYQTYPMELREIPKPSEPTKKSKRA